MRKRGLLFLVLLAMSGVAAADRVKDLASVAGVRSNPLIGYGLVVGLDGSGDRTTQAPFTVQSLRSMLSQLGIVIPPNVNPQLENVAAVAIHAELPAFAKPGQQIDITVSSIGNAESLRGGSLLMTPLRGIDGNVYAVAQGNLVVGGLGVSGNDGSRVSINIPSSGRIPNGAMVERSVPGAMASGDILLNLHSPDFTTASRLVDGINAALGTGSARAMDAVTVSVLAPQDPSRRVQFMAMLESIDIEPGAAAAKVVINSRTGTIVIGQHVTVAPAAVTHGSLSVTIQEGFGISQPAPFSDGETVVVPDSRISVDQIGDGRMFLFEPGTTLEEIVRAVNRVGAAPGDLVAILEALKKVGALRAELVVI